MIRDNVKRAIDKCLADNEFYYTLGEIKFTENSLECDCQLRNLLERKLEEPFCEYTVTLLNLDEQELYEKEATVPEGIDCILAINGECLVGFYSGNANIVKL